MMMSSLPVMLTVPEASERTNLSVGEVRRLCNEGAIAHIRVGTRGRKYLVNLDSLVEYLSNSGKREEADND